MELEDRFSTMGPLGTPLDGNERYIVFSMVGEDDVLPTDFIGGCGGKIHKLTKNFKNKSTRDKK